MNILVVGATGGTGRRTVTDLSERGHHVTAFARQTRLLGTDAGAARLVDGDATDPAAVADAVAGQDAVIVTLGISESPVRVRLQGPRGTAPDVRSIGTIAVIEAMRRHDVHRLVVLSSYGVGGSRDLLGLADRMVFRLLLKPQIDDTERQEAAVHASGLDWVIVQPVHLTDGPETGTTFVSTSSEVQAMRITRRQVARALSDAAEQAPPHRTIAVSTATSTTRAGAGRR
jgi:nucleoside-diphosphate-sugar epimerase